MQQCKADQEQKCQKQVATREAYRAVNRLRMAARRALEWIERLEGPAVSLDRKYQTCLQPLRLAKKSKLDQGSTTSLHCQTIL